MQDEQASQVVEKPNKLNHPPSRGQNKSSFYLFGYTNYDALSSNAKVLLAIFRPYNSLALLDKVR